MISTISTFVVPCLIFFPILVALVMKENVFKLFIDGAMEGLKMVVTIAPYVLAIFVAVNMFKDTGVINIFATVLKPILNLAGIPIDVLPLIVFRPVSGSACMPIVIDIFKRFGPDSTEGLLSSVIMSASETTLYSITILFGCIGIKNTRGTLIAGLLADLTVVVMAVLMFKLGII